MRKQVLEPRPKKLDERFVDHLEEEVRLLREDLKFATGKIERLELALFAAENHVAHEYVARTDGAKPRTRLEGEIPAGKSVKPHWRDVKAEWAKMTPEQQEAALAGKPAEAQTKAS